ncbi:MAG TPA: hypothetical protein VKP65_23740 [Rhodothermales bacterium]|nr:hypothetical protein [Rhodothermales bacterium]
MSSDIKLDEYYVIVEGRFLKAQIWDLMLDHPDRRKTNSPYRRALVHDFNDGLTVNWNNDYPGGITLNGVRIIRKDPNFISPVTIVGGVNVNEGNLHVGKGNKLLLSDEHPTDDWAHGEIYQTDEGLQVDGGRYSQGADQKPVSVHAPIAKKTIKWGDWSTESVNRVSNRARPGGSSSARGGTTTLLAGTALAATITSSVALRGALPIEFDVVDTFIQILDELSELRERVAELEASVNS